MLSTLLVVNLFVQNNNAQIERMHENKHEKNINIKIITTSEYIPAYAQSSIA